MNRRLSDYEVAAFTAFVLHSIDMDTRGRLMKELPEVYNKLVGRRVVASVVLCSCGEAPRACACADREASEEPATVHHRDVRAPAS